MISWPGTMLTWPRSVRLPRELILRLRPLARSPDSESGRRVSVLSQKFAVLYHGFAGALYRQKRSMDARMSSADLVHLKGLGSALWHSMKEAMSVSSAVTLR